MTQVFGNTSGLAPHAHRTLERIYRRRVPLDAITTPELNRALAEASKETRRQVGVLVARSGDIEQVIVGDTSKLMLPDVGRLRAAQGRLRGIRLIHTHLFGEELSRDDIVDLVRLRLDLLAALLLSPDGEPRSLHYAYNVPPAPGAGQATDRVPPYRTVGPLLTGRLDVNFGELVRSLEDEFSRSVKALKANEAKDGRAILVHVAEKAKPDSLLHSEERLRELAELARTAGVDVVDSVLQVRERIDPRHVLGKGKLDEVLLRSAELDAHTLIFDHELSPSQASSIGARTELKIIDRTQLILDIFAQHAETSDGKLQVELAQLKYALPRLGQKDDSLSRLTGGIGGRGPGETKLEIGRRRAKERVSHLEAQLKKRSQERQQRRKRRARAAIPIVSVVGYTNAGKSTLLNTLTGAAVIAEDKLFATLDPRSRRLRFPEEREVVITDTVGFIRDLPADLFAAFRATFEEVADATLLLHVVDASDPAAEQHIRTTEELLAELELATIPRILVFNKVDRVDADRRRQLALRHGDVALVSAIEPATTRPLLEKMAELLKGKWAESALYPSYEEPFPAEAEG